MGTPIGMVFGTERRMETRVGGLPFATETKRDLFLCFLLLRAI